jgi:hypothetical protein
VDLTEEATTAVTISTGEALALDISDLVMDQAVITVGVIMAEGITVAGGMEVEVTVVAVVMAVEVRVAEVRVAGVTAEGITRNERGISAKRDAFANVGKASPPYVLKSGVNAE